MSAYPVIRLMLPDRTLEFSGEEVIDAVLVEEIDPISAELPISTIEFKIVQYDESFSMFAGEIYQQLSERLPVVVYERIDGVNVLMGRFFLDDWENVSENEFLFKAVNIIGVMEKTDFDGLFWSESTRLETMLAQVLNPIGVSYVLHDDLKDLERSGWIAPGNYRKALQQICFAAGASATTARRQSLLIKPLSLSEEAILTRVFTEISDGDKLMDQLVKLLPFVTSIELIAHSYTEGTQQEVVFEQYLEAGSHKIVFQKPLYNLTVEGPGYAAEVMGTEDGHYVGTEDGNYIEAGGEYNFGPNVLYLNISEGGIVKITGFPRVDSMQSFFYKAPAGVGAANKLTMKIEDATLVGPGSAPDILDRLADYFDQRYEKNMKLLPTNVKIDSTILTTTIHHNYILGNVEKMVFNLAGGFLSDVMAIGIHVDAIYSRTPRCGIAVAGSSLTWQNKFRERTFVVRRF